MIKIIDFKTKARSLTPQEQAAGENVMANCLEVKPGEKVLIVTDTLKEKVEAPIFFESAKKFSDKVTMIVMNPSSRNGIEPPLEVAKMILESNVVLIPTTYSISHTKAVGAHNHGVRIASMPGISIDTILRTLTGDFLETDKLSEQIAVLLTYAKVAELTSPSGTNIVIPLGQRKAMADLYKINKPGGDFGNLPAGEALIAPLEGQSHGVIVFEDCYGEEDLKEPLALEVKQGIMTKVLGTHRIADKLIQILNEIGPKARNIAELGVGTNKMAKPKKGLLEVEKIHGTCHIALGNNKYFGGEVDVPYHVDGLIIYPTLKLDGKTIIKNGKFVI